MEEVKSLLPQEVDPLINIYLLLIQNISLPKDGDFFRRKGKTFNVKHNKHNMRNHPRGVAAQHRGLWTVQYISVWKTSLDERSNRSGGTIFSLLVKGE